MQDRGKTSGPRRDAGLKARRYIYTFTLGKLLRSWRGAGPWHPCIPRGGQDLGFDAV
jgi:hypothetical protein